MIFTGGAVMMLVLTTKGTKFESYVMILLSSLAGGFGTEAKKRWKIAKDITNE